MYRHPRLKTIEPKTRNVLFSRFIIEVAGVVDVVGVVRAVAGKVVAGKAVADKPAVGMVMAMSAAHMVVAGMAVVDMVGPIHLGGHCPKGGNGPEVAVAASDTFQQRPARQPRLGQGRKNPCSAGNGDQPFDGGGARRYGG